MKEKVIMSTLTFILWNGIMLFSTINQFSISDAMIFTVVGCLRIENIFFLNKSFTWFIFKKKKTTFFKAIDQKYDWYKWKWKHWYYFEFQNIINDISFHHSIENFYVSWSQFWSGKCHLIKSEYNLLGQICSKSAMILRLMIGVFQFINQSYKISKL